MRLNDIAMIAADTSRTRAYLQFLVRHGLEPSHLILLENTSDTLQPGQVSDEQVKGYRQHEGTRGIWKDLIFNPSLSVHTLLDREGWAYEPARDMNINDPRVVEQIMSRPESTFIYSGYGGVILGKGLMESDRNFLHVHGGYLPDFKGSTTNYYSLLEEGALGASAIFLTDEIDSGPIIRRRTFPPPPDRSQMDHIYDSAVRAAVLVETLQEYVEKGRWEFEVENNEGGHTHYIIHPLLKHMAILGGR